MRPDPTKRFAGPHPWHQIITDGVPYMDRRQLASVRLGSYVYQLRQHIIHRPDADRHPHNHACSFWSFIWRGSYDEVRAWDGVATDYTSHASRRSRFSLRYCPRGIFHAITKLIDGPVHTLVLARFPYDPNLAVDEQGFGEWGFKVDGAYVDAEYYLAHPEIYRALRARGATLDRGDPTPIEEAGFTREEIGVFMQTWDAVGKKNATRVRRSRRADSPATMPVKEDGDFSAEASWGHYPHTESVRALVAGNALTILPTSWGVYRESEGDLQFVEPLEAQDKDIDAVALIERMARGVVELADKMGVILTVENVARTPRTPLAMGNHEHAIHVRRAREKA